MTLNQEPVFSLLHREFEVGWQNVVHEESAGKSQAYRPDQPAVGSSNGAGARNTQLLILSGDGVVLHALAGFWHPEDLAEALRFSLKVRDLWVRSDLSPTEKRVRYQELHQTALEQQKTATTARSFWQVFDTLAEKQRLEQGPRDTAGDHAGTWRYRGFPSLKPLNRLVHERMMARPFRRVEEFDLDRFADWGRPHYNANRWIDGRGVTFYTLGFQQKLRQKWSEHGQCEPAGDPPTSEAP